MKHLLLILTLLLLTPLPAAAQTKKISADPICIASKLAEQKDSTKIANLCEYYGYHPLSTEDGYSIFQNAKGSQIRFSITKCIDGKQYPTIEVKAKATSKAVADLLEELNYQHKGNYYERKIFGRQIRCTTLPNGLLRFTTDH